MYDKNGITMFLMIIIVTLGGLWLYQRKESYVDSDHGIYSGFPYARLGGGYNTQLFSPTISKRCAGGPYMYTSNPYLQAVCQGSDFNSGRASRGIPNDELAQVACGKAFHGRPVHFDYTSLSDGAWDNALCNTPLSSSLCVL
jgi:hypothetical protein